MTRFCPGGLPWMTSTPPLDAIRPYTTGDFAMDERTELELKHVFERIKNGPRGEFAVNYRTDAEQRTANEWRDDPVKLLRQEADRLAKAVAEAEVAQDQDRACEIALAALSR
jgi:hypothetical protein